MIQIRLSKGGGGGTSGGASGDGGGSVAGKPTAAVGSVTVACLDHLVLADLPVAQSLGAITASSVKSVGRRARRHHGERVHFCVCCDFPIAIYGRLIPCEHAFCLSCASSNSRCYLCEERIQRIQTIKLMEEIYVCGAPHCLKSFLKRSELEAHIHGTHGNLVALNVGKDVPNEDRPLNSTKPSSTDAQISTARAPARSSGFSPSSNSQHQNKEDWTRHHQSRDPPPGVPHTFDRPYNWIPPPATAAAPCQRNPEASFPNFPPLPNRAVNYPYAVGGFPDNLAHPWGAGPVGVVQMGQGIAQGFGNLADAQAGFASAPLPVKESDSLSLQPPLPRQPPPLSQQQQHHFNRSRDISGFGWLAE